jgi:putative transposase
MGLRNRKRFQEFQCFFVTTSCKDHLHLLQLDVCKKVVIDSVAFLKTKYNVHVLGYVIMPNHLHFILYFEKENKLSAYMRDLKKYTSFEIRRILEQLEPKIFEKLRYHHRNQLFKVWEDGFDDLYLVSRSLLEVKLKYIHCNPLQEYWSLVDHPEEYLYSSASFYEKELQTGIEVTHYREFF